MIDIIKLKSTKSFLLMRSFLNSKNISKLHIKWPPFLRAGVSYYSGSSDGMSKDLLTTSMMFTNTKSKYIMTLNSINRHPKPPLTQQIVKFAAIKTLPSTKIYVHMHTVWSAGDLISKHPSNQPIPSPNVWVASVLFFSKLSLNCCQYCFHMKVALRTLTKNSSVNNSQLSIEIINFVQEPIVETVLKSIT